MRKYIYLFLILCCLSPHLYGGNVTGNCTSYSQEGRDVTFHLDDNSAVQLQLCSPSVVRVWFSPDGKLQRGNPSFAVINEELEDVGTVQVDEQNACYEIFTPKLRIRINKAPFSLQIFDKYQKLLFSDYADKGHISDGERKVSIKPCAGMSISSVWVRRPASWTAEANLIRCGTVINLVTALWKIPCTRVSLSL